ncbi:MAG: sulfurtransferase [Acidobacteriota bacterium]
MAEYAHPEVLVTTDWVEQHLNDTNLRLVEVDVDTALYEQGHLQGAVGWNWQSQLQDQVRRDILSKDEFQNLMSESGIGNNTAVILYGDNNNWFAAYALWQMKLYGHKDVRLMNGGRKKWVEENRALTTDVPDYPAANHQAQDPDQSIRARRQQVRESLDQLDRVALVDVRSPDEFTGKIIAPPGLPETAQRAGRIPGAQNIPWGQAVQEDGTFKSADELAQLYGSKGVTEDKDTIAYCRIGERSSHTWFALKYLLGYPNVTNYDGSWTEWGNLVDAPVARGPE